MNTPIIFSRRTELMYTMAEALGLSYVHNINSRCIFFYFMLGYSYPIKGGLCNANDNNNNTGSRTAKSNSA